MSGRQSRIPQVTINGARLSDREMRTLRIALGSLQLDLQTSGREAKSLPEVNATAAQDVAEHLRNLQKLVSLIGDMDPDEDR